MHRLDQKRVLEQEHFDSRQSFLMYHMRSIAEADRQTLPIRETIAALSRDFEKLAKVKPVGEAENLLRGLILCVSELNTISNGLIENCVQANSSTVKEQIRLLSAVLRRCVDQYFLHFNNMLTPYLLSVLSLSSSMSELVHIPNALKECLSHLLL